MASKRNWPGEKRPPAKEKGSANEFGKFDILKDPEARKKIIESICASVPNQTIALSLGINPRTLYLYTQGKASEVFDPEKHPEHIVVQFAKELNEAKAAKLRLLEREIKEDEDWRAKDKLFDRLAPKSDVDENKALDIYEKAQQESSGLYSGLDKEDVVKYLLGGIKNNEEH